jgi:glycosyltransferase involved in cell wall biosynthesis
VFSRAEGIIVLSTDFKIHLRAIGLRNPVYVETTTVQDDAFDAPGTSPRSPATGDRGFEILFLSRVERYKGIRETIEAYKILRSRTHHVRLTIAGVGDDLEAVKRYVHDEGIEGVTFAGHLVGEMKARAFLRSDVYVLPSYGEGMPISVLEAMAFGVPVVVTCTGGLRDFFEHGKMGFLAERADPEVISTYIQTLIRDRRLARRMSRYNRRYARDRFAASRVAGRLEQIYRHVGSET